MKSEKVTTKQSSKQKTNIAENIQPGHVQFEYLLIITWYYISYFEYIIDIQSILEIMRKADQSVVAEAVEKIPSGLRQRYFDLKDTHHNEVHAPAAPVLKATIANHAPASSQ